MYETCAHQNFWNEIQTWQQAAESWSSHEREEGNLIPVSRSRAMFSVAFNPYRNPRISGSYFVVSIVSSIEKAPVFWNSSSSWHLMIHHINLAGLSYKGRTTFLIEMAMFRLMSELWAHSRSTGAMLLRLWTKSVEECLYSPSVCQQQFFYWQSEGKRSKDGQRKPKIACHRAVIYA